LPKSELAGVNLEELNPLMERSIELARGLDRSAALAATERMAEAQRVKEPGDYVKWFWQTWKPEPDKVFPMAEDKLEFGF